MAADPESALARFLEDWVERGEVTAAFAVVASPERTIWSGGAATAGQAAPGATSLFDAASLTKPWMATLALRLDAAGELSLGTRLGEVWPECAAAISTTTLGDLLRHRAGFEPWTALYRRCRTRADAERLLISGALLEGGRRDRRSGGSRSRLDRSTRVKRGTGTSTANGERGPSLQRYSDLDYITWGFAAERQLGQALPALLRRALLKPMGVGGVEVSPGARPGVVPCRCDNAREVELAREQRLRVPRHGPPAVGEPQDGNARFLDGLAGHAGLFVTAEAAVELGREWLAAVTGRDSVVPRAGALAALAGRGEYALGWARRRVSGSAGRALSSAAFGHVGFTGTSLWIDPAAGTVLVLLAHRRDAGGQLNVARRRFHTLAAACARRSC